LRRTATELRPATLEAAAAPPSSPTATSPDRASPSLSASTIAMLAIGAHARGYTTRLTRPTLAERQINSNHTPMAVPRCAAVRGDGAPCDALAFSPTAVFCRHHEQLAEKHGEDPIRSCCYPRTRTPRQVAPVEAQLESQLT
jgi:hypothetical protein